MSWTVDADQFEQGSVVFKAAQLSDSQYEVRLLRAGFPIGGALMPGFTNPADQLRMHLLEYMADFCLVGRIDESTALMRQLEELRRQEATVSDSPQTKLLRVTLCGERPDEAGENNLSSATR
ncbi:MAG: hypothetical protein M1144_06060 [Candidatus Thermoplasmatota archaeon]|nr:hypothetical protein [Candidatus Thermoplasmatota archaeon]